MNLIDPIKFYNIIMSFEDYKMPHYTQAMHEYEYLVSWEE